jgi:hypothetical protein
LHRWVGDPWPVLGSWALGALAVSAGLLVATWAIASVITPDPTPVYIRGLTYSADLGDFGYLIGNNLIVLALHATACVAGFMAGSSLPQVASGMSGVSRFIHEKAGPIAIWWVVIVTSFSLVTQAYALGVTGSAIAGQLGISPALLIVTVLPHALIELTAVFLPLAAWIIASRRDRWDELLAATALTVAVAVPMIVVAAAVEILLWPETLKAVTPVV